MLVGGCATSEEDMQFHAHAADHADAFAEIDLRMTRRMGQRHKVR
jgi:hypothetical protein